MPTLRACIALVLIAQAFSLAIAKSPARAQVANTSEPERRVYAAAQTQRGDLQLVADLYRPREGPVKGAIVIIHGGGFATGDPVSDENRAYGISLAERGYVAAAISYRLIGDQPTIDGWAEAYSRMVRGYSDPRMAAAIERLGPGFPDAVAAAAVDLVTAIRWLRSHADELGFQPQDVAMFGASAGAISALTTAYNMDLFGAQDLQVAAVIDLRGLLLNPRDAPNPFEQRDAPLLILHGEGDQRVPLSDAETVFQLASEAGTPVEFYTAPGMGHELGGVELLDLRVEDGRTVLDKIDAFVESAFDGTIATQRTVRGRLLQPPSSATDPEDDDPAAASDNERQGNAAPGDSLLRERIALDHARTGSAELSGPRRGI
jgi:acetyl esterase/lipase